jgi:opine dehydrogenase
MGLCIYKGIADIVDVPTPMMDTILRWAQAHMGKELVVQGKLKGKDVGETAAPQRFGLMTLQDLISGQPVLHTSSSSSAQPYASSL